MLSFCTTHSGRPNLGWTVQILTLLTFIALLLPTSALAATPVVGDGNYDGVFNGADIDWAQTTLRHGSTWLVPLADVAEPCNGVPDSADGRRLLAALLAARDGVSVESRCHGQAIGTQLEPPPSPPARVTTDDLLLAVGDAVPGFAGLWIQGDYLMVALTDPSPTLLHESVLAIEEVFGEERFASLEPVSRQVDYEFAELYAWKESVMGLFDDPAVTSVDADEQANRVRIGLTDLGERGRIAAELARDEVPAEALVFEERGLGRANSVLVDEIRSKQRPLRGGVHFAIEEPAGVFGCTLGFLARWYGVSPVWVSNAHCVAPMGTVASLPAFQYSVGPVENQALPEEADLIGAEAVDPPLLSNQSARWSDAALGSLIPGVTANVGWLAGSPGGSSPGSYYGHYKVVSKGPSVCGEAILRVGAVNGQQHGTVTGTSCTVKIDSADFAPKAKTTLYSQTETDMASDEGDSGGPVFRLVGSSGTEVELLGIHSGSFGGNDAYFSPISNIESELGVLEVGEHNMDPQVEIISPADGANLGGGGMPAAALDAQVWDFEDGGECPTCVVDWFSAKDGGPLVSTPWIAGQSGTGVTLSGGPGWRAITATAFDGDGNSSWKTVVVSSGNTDPKLYIDWPTANDSLWTGVDYGFQASSFDNEDFAPLPCTALQWTFLGGTPATGSGCHPVVSFDSPGLWGATVSASDGDGGSGSASVAFLVSAPQGPVAPVVSFVQPGAGSILQPGQNQEIEATVSDPNANGPMDLEWTIDSPYLIAGSGPVVVATSTEPTSGTVTLSLDAGNWVKAGCGPRAFTLRLTATRQADQLSDYAELPLAIFGPLC